MGVTIDECGHHFAESRHVQYTFSHSKVERWVNFAERNFRASSGPNSGRAVASLCCT